MARVGGRDGQGVEPAGAGTLGEAGQRPWAHIWAGVVALPGHPGDLAPRAVVDRMPCPPHSHGKVLILNAMALGVGPCGGIGALKPEPSLHPGRAQRGGGFLQASGRALSNTGHGLPNLWYSDMAARTYSGRGELKRTFWNKKESKDEDKQGACRWGQAVHRQSREDVAELRRWPRIFQKEPHGPRMGVVVFLHLSLSWT